jgi:effector-binding domain-containing protein
MNDPRLFRMALLILVPMTLALSAASAQSPTAPPTPAPSATPAPPPAETKSPGDLPSTAPKINPPAPVQSADPFGEEITLASGNSMIVYTATDDTGFSYLAEIPVEQEPKNLPKAISVAKSPDGKALKFVHRGSYENMDNTYEAITNHLDDKKLEAKDTFIEEYITDPLKTRDDKLVINVYVPLK